MPPLPRNETIARADDLDAEIGFFAGLGFRLVEILPADDPREALLVHDDLALRLRRGHQQSVTVALAGRAETAVSPAGNRVESTSTGIARPVIEPALVSVGPDSDWVTGRAGMLYRDLVPGRLGGSVIASHIRIPTGGPVPDYVHHHEVAFQLIHCHRGWVRVVYEGQGDPFVLHPGDLVIQPPGIRHRVLESSDEMHVVEIGWPAEHATRPDTDFDLPGPLLTDDHRWGGQRFVRHHERAVRSGPGSIDTGVGSATDGLAQAETVELTPGSRMATPKRSAGTFDFWFVDEGRLSMTVGSAAAIDLVEGSSVVVPPGRDATFTAVAPTRLLHVMVDTSHAA